jgi:hypothetical protein
MQQALVMAPQRGVIHSGFLGSRSWIPSLPSGCGSVGPCMWACVHEHERERERERGRETWVVWCIEGGSSSRRDQQGRGDLHGPVSDVSKCYGRWTRERPCRRCARTVDHSATYRGLKTLMITSLCPPACVCMLASSGERDTFGVGC